MTIAMLAFSTPSQMQVLPSGGSLRDQVTTSKALDTSTLPGSTAYYSTGLGATLDQSRILYLSNITTPLSIAEHMAKLVDPNTIESIVSYLSGFDNRYTGSQGSLGAISYIQKFFRINCSIQDVLFDNFTFNDQGVLLRAVSIIARINSTHQTAETILLTAHHDTIGYQYPFNIYSIGARGADDDASGIGAMLETARILSIFRDRLRYNLVFIAFAAEEGNKTLDPDFMCQGSKHWVSSGHPGVTELRDIVAVVDLDGVAYKNGGPIGIYHHSSGSNVASNISSVASLLGIPANDEREPRSDSYVKTIRCRTEDVFDVAKIAVATLSSHYPNPSTHTSLDTLSQLDFDVACNFTKVVISYIFLTSGVMPECERIYSRDWSSVIDFDGRFELKEYNYITINFNPNIVSNFDLIVLDPSIGGAPADLLLQVISLCNTQGRRLPIVSLGKTGLDLLRVLNLRDVEIIEGNSSNNDLIAYVGSSLTDLDSHPVYNSPNNVSLAIENSTHLSYTILDGQSVDNSYYLVRNESNTYSGLLMLGYTPLLSKLWGWLALLHDDKWSCGPISLVGVENGSSMTSVARSIVENTVVWLINGSRTVTVTRLSERSPLVGDSVKISVSVRDSLTWEGDSSTPVDLKVFSPGGWLILNETRVTDENGVSESSSLLVKEIGEHRMILTTDLGSQGVTRIVTLFTSSPRIRVAQGNDQITVPQGESLRIELNLTFLPTQPDMLILGVTGEPISSVVSMVATLRHGYNNVTLAITAKETIRVGEYNLTFTAMPATMEYVACSQFIRIRIAPAYEVIIIEAPSRIDQLSSVQLHVQVKSYRSIVVNCSLRIDSHGAMLVGEVTMAISPGETKQVTLQVEETSSSPYTWGEGEIRVALIRNGSVIVESQPAAVYVSLGATNLALGYLLPAVLPVAIFIERSRRIKAQLAASGTLLGGYAFFAVGLVLYQSMFMVVPLTMMVLGGYVGTMTMKHIYDLPLPKGYDWFISQDTEKETLTCDDNPACATASVSDHESPESGIEDIGRLRELYRMGSYREVVPAAYMIAVNMMSDLLMAVEDTSLAKNPGKAPATKGRSDSILTGIMKQLTQKRISVPCETALHTLEETYKKYARLGRFNRNDFAESNMRYLAQSSIDLVANLLKQQSGERMRARKS